MKRLSTRTRRLDSEAPVNPMDGLGNLADAMLVLAVGIMLALILNWKVDISSVSAEPEPENEQIMLTDEDMTDANPEALDEETLQRIGALYYDETTGTYYAITGD